MTHPHKFVQQLPSDTPCHRIRFAAQPTPIDHEGWQSDEEINGLPYTLNDHINDLQQDVANGTRPSTPPGLPSTSTTSTAMSISAADLKAMFDGLAQTLASAQAPSTSSAISCLIETLSMFNGKDHSQTKLWVASFKAYLQVNKKSFEDDECKTDTPMYGSPDITYNDEDSLPRVLIVLSCMEGKAAEWATEQCQKWATQCTENWKAVPTHTRNVVWNVPMDSFWKEFLKEWGDVRTWVEAETELESLYQKESNIIDFWIRFRDLAQKANYPPDNNPTLCGMFRQKLSYHIQNHWTQPGLPEVQFFSIKAAFEHAISIEQTLKETATRQSRGPGSSTTCSYPAKTTSAKAPTPVPDSAPQSNATTTFDITKVRCYNCEGKGHFAKDCPKPKKPRKAKALAAQGESDVKLQLEHAMTNSLAQMEARSNSLSVRGSERTTASRNCHSGA
jgi:hypothetical protein